MPRSAATQPTHQYHVSYESSSSSESARCSIQTRSWRQFLQRVRLGQERQGTFGQPSTSTPDGRAGTAVVDADDAEATEGGPVVATGPTGNSPTGNGPTGKGPRTPPTGFGVATDAVADAVADAEADADAEVEAPCDETPLLRSLRSLAAAAACSGVKTVAGCMAKRTCRRESTKADVHAGWR
jgi:hypothetical protein